MCVQVTLALSCGGRAVDLAHQSGFQSLNNSCATEACSSISLASSPEYTRFSKATLQKLPVGPDIESHHATFVYFCKVFGYTKLDVLPSLRKVELARWGGLELWG